VVDSAHFLTTSQRLGAGELREAWPALDDEERAAGFRLLDRYTAADFFASLDPPQQLALLERLEPWERQLWLRSLAPDDAADLLQELPSERRRDYLALFDEPTSREISALLAYAEDAAGGLMNPRFARVRPEMRVDEAIRYLQRQARDGLQTIYYAYVLDPDQALRGVSSFRQLFMAPPHRQVHEIMTHNPISVRDDLDQEAVADVMRQNGFLALPVVDAGDRMKGIVTIDDIVDVLAEEATEDAQKYGGMEALGAPYLQTSFFRMIRKRAGWLAVLFVGEMLTASAMGFFENEIARAVVLALFVPLIISSGGNAGSQASTLIVRAMALGEVRLRDWWRIVRRELAAGVVLGVFLAAIGVVRILAWQLLFESYGAHPGLIAITVGLSLIGIVAWGTLAGSMLPFVLRKLGFDPASASAPFVATLVDVCGLLIYFSVARVVLGGTLL
jgi:magnesium transporter